MDLKQRFGTVHQDDLRGMVHCFPAPDPRVSPELAFRVYELRFRFPVHLVENPYGIPWVSFRFLTTTDVALDMMRDRLVYKKGKYRKVPLPPLTADPTDLMLQWGPIVDGEIDLATGMVVLVT